MTQPHCTAIGTITHIANVTPQSGKPYVALDLEMSPEERTGKGYKQRVTVRVAGEKPSRCIKGAIVSISGPGSLSLIPGKEKQYPKLTIYGRPEVVVDAPGEESYDDVRPLSPIPPDAPKQAAQPALIEEDGEVPF